MLLCEEWEGNMSLGTWWWTVIMVILVLLLLLLRVIVIIIMRLLLRTPTICIERHEILCCLYKCLAALYGHFCVIMLLIGGPFGCNLAIIINR